ncbi:MAG: hypothetical protein Q4P07_13670 [Ornithinimicrobium sp.]|uniref:ABC transporter permease n=1 Tax=Ornithinimicrobium sp. TaxID=1977084 RepID=UPI0026E0E230|nr:hypothetical protein [Ornithinimicrobium sp.]MDO5741186.1 hypothetical protein [Ornithinimicrobium sp.]
MTGLGTLLRLALRRNRWFYLIWVLGLASVVPITAAAYETIIGPGGAMLDLLARNPTMRAMLGPPIDLSAAGSFTVWRVGTFAATAAGVMAVLGVIRSTRADEEEGRTELLRSTVVDRHAPLTAGVLAGLIACAALGLLITVSMIGVGTGVRGSLAFGLGMALVAAVFVGVGAVAAQITASARGARGIGMAVLGAAYIWRAVTDAQPDSSAAYAWHWGSPLEWMALVRPYAGERWWVLALPAALTLGLVAGAFALESRRDHGSGLRAVRPGRDRAAASLLSVGGLAWRLQWGTLVGWTLGLGIFAVAMGSLSGSFASMLKDVPQLEVIFRRMGQGAEQLIDAFFVAMLGIVSVIIAILAVMLWQRLATEERRGHAELVLSTAVPRTRYAVSHLLIAALAPVALLALVGALLSAPEAMSRGSAAILGQVVGAALALAPGGLLILSLAVALHGWVPRLDWLVWVVVGWSLFMVWVGTTLGLPTWLTQLTPWAPLPKLPVDPMSWTPVIAMTLLSVAVMVLGLWGYRRRDLRMT